MINIYFICICTFGTSLSDLIITYSNGLTKSRAAQA